MDFSQYSDYANYGNMAMDDTATATYTPFRVALGVSQYYKANKALKELEKTPMARYNITPEQTRSYNRAENMANVGFTGAEKAAFNQQVASSQNRAFRNALNVGGGNAARGISGALGASRLSALNNFAANDASLKRRNVAYADQVGRGLTNQRNTQTAQDIAYRMELERTLGRARSLGIENIANAMGGQALMASARNNNNATEYDFSRFFNGGAPQGNNYNQEAIPFGYTQPNNPYGGGFNSIPPSNNYYWGGFGG